MSTLEDFKKIVTWRMPSIESFTGERHASEGKAVQHRQVRLVRETSFFTKQSCVNLTTSDVPPKTDILQIKSSKVFVRCFEWWNLVAVKIAGGFL